MKQGVFFALIISNLHASEWPKAVIKQQLIVAAEKKQEAHALLNIHEKNLVQSSTATSMGWLPALYDASGLSGCMGRERFMVNALAKMKEAITNEENRLASLRLCAGLGGMPLVVDEHPEKYTLLGCNFLVSGLALFGTFLYKVVNASPAISVTYPRQVPLLPVQTSCDRIYSYLGQMWGMDWAHECIMKSNQYDYPCNVTANREYVKEHGGYFYDASACCFDRVDPQCNKVIIDYMNITFPLLKADADTLYTHLKNQAIRATSMPFYITASGVITLNLLFQLARYKYRRYMREKAANSVPTVDEEVTALGTTLNQE